MARSPHRQPVPRAVAPLGDAAVARASIARALVAKPVRDHILQHAVATFVDVERDAGVCPNEVIFRLGELLDDARITPVSVYEARRRQVMRWCVEAYFGHLSAPQPLRDIPTSTVTSSITPLEIHHR